MKSKNLVALILAVATFAIPSFVMWFTGSWGFVPGFLLAATLLTLVMSVFEADNGLYRFTSIILYVSMVAGWSRGHLSWKSLVTTIVICLLGQWLVKTLYECAQVFDEDREDLEDGQDV